MNMKTYTNIKNLNARTNTNKYTKMRRKTQKINIQIHSTYEHVRKKT